VNIDPIGLEQRIANSSKQSTVRVIHNIQPVKHRRNVWWYVSFNQFTNETEITN